MELFPVLESINVSKLDLIEENSLSEEQVEKYPKFMVMRMLSYHPDAIMLLNEINMRGKAEHAISNTMHYRFLLDVLPKRKRFTKLARPERDERIQLIMRVMQYSYQKAVSVVDLFDDADFEQMASLEGGAT